jgi:CRISPR-associated protein Cas5t
MKVLRIEMEGAMTSFRYPHLHVGRQLSYPMPPPATIYGHVCSALGDWIDPGAARFAYIFSCAGAGDDLELLHIASVGSGRIDKAWGYEKNLDVQTNVFPRQILLHPKMILYLEAEAKTEEWLNHFRSPRYPVLLGRSQDLGGYKDVKIIDLEQSDFGYYEQTLLPWGMRDCIPDGATFQMPRFIDPQARNNVVWDRYIELKRRIWLPGRSVEAPKGAMQAMRREEDSSVWIDPESPDWHGGRRILAWHTWV